MSKLAPVHPGEILLEDFMKPLNLSANALATALRVPATRIGDIIKGRRGITAETALRLAKCFGTTPDVWMNLQKHYELAVAEREVAKEIERDVHEIRRPVTAHYQKRKTPLRS
jgi:antitoxin HigA-1